MSQGEGPRIEGDELLCSGRRVKLIRRTVVIGGERVEKDLVSFGSSVVILPIIEDGRAVFLEQWRASVNSWVLELPAGRVERGESMNEAALRELEEETGYRAGSLEKLASAYVAPGYSDEIIHLFIARDLTPGRPHPERGEFLRTVLMKPEDYLLSGSNVKDLKTLASVLLYLTSSRR